MTELPWAYRDPLEPTLLAEVPLLYTTGDRFHHDLALPMPPLAGLEPLRELATLDPASDAGRFTVAALVRERNRVVHALEEAADVIADLLKGKETRS